MPLRTKVETLITSIVDGATITAASRTSAIPAGALYVFPPNYFDIAGKQILIKASGRISSIITTPGTARFDVNLLDSAAVNAIPFDGLAVLLEDGEAHTNVHWELEILMTLRTVGATGNFFGQGRWSSTDIQNRFGLAANPVGGLSAMLPWNAAPAVGANFNTTLSNTLDLRFTQTAATGSMTLHQFSLIAMN